MFTKENYKEIPTEIAFLIKEGHFTIDKASSGYSYDIYGPDYNPVNGGVY